MTVPIAPTHAATTELTIAAARSGDHAAIGAVCSLAFKRIVAFYRYTGVQVEVAEDLAADAVESIITRLPTLRNASAFDAWMWTIARNRLRDHWRHRKVEGIREPLTPAPDGPEDLAIINDEHARVRKALATLTLRDQELLWLREVVGLDYRAVAERVECTPASARVACHRARTRLHKAYEQYADRTNG